MNSTPLCVCDDGYYDDGNNSDCLCIFKKF